MNAAVPPLDGSGGPLHSLVAWPPEALDTWLRRTQERLGVRAFGAPHLNLRAPFQTPLRGHELVAALRGVLAGQPAFEVRVLGFRHVPSVIFLECERSPELAELHRRVLDIGPSSRAPYDGADYRPHLTLALGVLPWAEEALRREVGALRAPLERFTVEALSLTREARGEVQELHTFPLLERGPLAPGEAGLAEPPPAGEVPGPRLP